MNSPQETLENISRLYLIESYVPEMAKIFQDQTFNKQEISKEQQAAFFLTGMYLPSSVYSQQSALISSEFESNTSLDKNTLEQYLLLADKTKQYLARNDNLISNLSKKVEGKGLELLIEQQQFDEAKQILQEQKYNAIRETFDSVEDYILHIQEGLETQYSNVLLNAQLSGIQGEDLLKLGEDTLKTIQHYGLVLINEAQEVYNVKIGYDSSPNNSVEDKAA